MPHQYLLEQYDTTTWDTISSTAYPTPEAAIAATEYPSRTDWEVSGVDLILGDNIIQAEGHQYSRYGIRKRYVDGPEPSSALTSPHEVDVEREAWRMLLDGAESHCEDAINEDPDVVDDIRFDAIRDRACELIAELRASHNL